MLTQPNKKQIIVCRAGLLGDTLVALPALWMVKEAYPDSEITYVTEHISGRSYVHAENILAGSGLVDAFECYETHCGIIKKLLSYISLFINLRRRKIDLGIILEASHWSSRRALFFKLCGAGTIFEHPSNRKRFVRDADGFLVKTDHIADDLIKIIRQLPLQSCGKLEKKMLLPISVSEQEKVEAWINTEKEFNPAKKWIMIAPWSNMPSKRWPLDRFTAVICRLINKFDVIPIIFGSGEEKETAKKVILKAGRGICAAGALSVRESVYLASKCNLYIGNDTGAMHIAVSAGIPCVAIFSSIDEPGLWHPYGNNHTVFRTRIKCEGCLLRECTKEDMKCIKAISEEEVFEACCKYL